MVDYGLERCEFHIIADGMTLDEAVEVERILVDMYRPELLNQVAGGHGYKDPDEHLRAKKSASIKAMWNRPGYREKQHASFMETLQTPKEKQRRIDMWKNPETKARHTAGIRKALASLTVEQVGEIKYWLAKGFWHKEIAAMYGVSRGTISKIANGSRWRDVPAAEHAIISETSTSTGV